jgi:ABC-2 type transport system permease protein
MTTTSPRPDLRDDAGTHAAAVGPGPAATEGRAVSLPRVVTAEWIKLRSVRSTFWLLGATVVLIVGLGTVAALGSLLGELPADDATIDPVGGALSGISTTELVVAALGSLAVTTEYSSGLVRATLTAVPRRVPVLVAKAVVVASTVLVVTSAATSAAFLIARVLLAARGTSLPITAPGALRALVGAALYLAVVALLGVALGWLLRSTVGALAALVGLLYVLPVLAVVLPAHVGEHVLPYLPGNAGAAVMQLGPSAPLAPWTGFAVFVGYAAVALAGAALALRRRDA